MRSERLRQLREQSDLNQAQLAEKLGIGEQQIWRYENGETEPKGIIVAKIAVFFNVSTDYLLGLSDEPGTYQEKLDSKERAIIAALRRGERMEAIKLIANDEKAINGA